MKKSVFIFTRDLRLQDNKTLHKCLSESDIVILIFIFTPEQIENNKYKSLPCIKFMCETLDELNKEIHKFKSRLIYFYGTHTDIIKKIIKHDADITNIYMNRDYSPYAKKREKEINELCTEYNIVFTSDDDYYLIGNKVKNESGNNYVKFTPFYNKAQKIIKSDNNLVKCIEYIHTRKLLKKLINKNKIDFPFEYTKDINIFYKDIPEDYTEYINGGRSNCINIIKNITGYKNYNKSRDYPNLATTHLSAYIKFNVISIRELYNIFTTKLDKNNKLITQLFWRDFYMQIMDNNPHVIGHPMKTNYDIKWENNTSLFNKWKTGTTGIPIVDAGMRQLNKTGWMHNRVRMIVSNFLIKILRIDWMKGEKYFAQKLIDYDIAVNNGNWQWSSSTGADSQPYFRIFNPWRQAEKFDKDCIYIKEWVSELKDIPARDIIKWDVSYQKHKDIDYPEPIVANIASEAKKTIILYKQALKA